MIRQAEKKDVYSRFVEHDLTQPDQFPAELRNSFDLVCGAGIVNNNHLDESLFEQMMVAAKRSGLIVFASRFSYIGQYWYDSVLRKLEDQNRLKPVRESEVFHKYTRMEQSIGRFSRTPVKVFAYENTVDVETFLKS